MGEMADFALDEVEDDEILRTDFLLGKMTEVEAHEAGIIDEMGALPTASSGKAWKEYEAQEAERCEHGVLSGERCEDCIDERIPSYMR